MSIRWGTSWHGLRCWATRNWRSCLEQLTCRGQLGLSLEFHVITNAWSDLLPTLVQAWRDRAATSDWASNSRRCAECQKPALPSTCRLMAKGHQGWEFTTLFMH